MGFGRIRSRLGVFVARGRTAGRKAVSFIRKELGRGKAVSDFVGLGCFLGNVYRHGEA